MWSSIVIVFVVLVAQVHHHPASANGSCNQSCVTPRGERGTCQNIKSCEPLLQILRQYGNQAGDFLRQSTCFYVGMNPYVCCPSNGDDLNKKTENIMNNNNNNNNNGNNNNVNNNNGVSNNNNKRYGPLLSPECGMRAPSNVSKILVVGGTPSVLGDWPWIAVLGYRGSKTNPNKPRWLCGGSLISSRHVLTAAHCVYKLNDLYLVRLGELDLNKDDEGATPIDVLIERRTIHPQYNPNTYTNDVAVLRLDREIEFTNLIRPICLPVTEELRQKDFVDAFPALVGWGSVYFKGPTSSNLQQIQVPVVTPQECKDAFKNFKSATIDERVLCAGFAQGGKDSCQGDSGGPLMQREGQSYYAIGVISYGFRCAEPGFPGVYSRTTYFLDFILSLLN